MDFTTKVFLDLIDRVELSRYSSTSFYSFLKQEYTNKDLILRHDVDRKPENALRLARLEASKEVLGTFNFRTVPGVYNKTIIQEIADLGHEIGYHYENMDTCNGDIDAAWDDFRRNLDKLRKLYPVKTICMHGSPLSRYDNRDLWNKYDYRSVGIIGEPYFDIDYDEVFYLTDTGRRWDGKSVSVRDKVERKESNNWPTYHSTFDIIEAVKEGSFPEKAMINVHPQRWFDFGYGWVRELVLQNIKNVGKYFLAKYR